MTSLGEMEIKQENKGVHNVQFAGAKAGKRGKERPGDLDRSNKGVSSHHMN
jgi:hypothetical protein